MSKDNKKLPQNPQKLAEKANAENNEKIPAEAVESVNAVSAEKRNNPRRKHGVMSAVFTAVFIAAVIVLNIITGILTDRFNIKADLTADDLYTLSKQTENYLDNFLGTDISITVTSSEKKFVDGGDYFKQVNEILKKISSHSDKITLDYLELEKNPDFAAKYSDENLSDAYIVVENKKSGRYRVITPVDYFGLDDEEALYYYYYYGYIGQSLIEQETVSAMLYVSDDNPSKIVFTEGFGENGSEALSNLLKKNGYEVETVNLLTGEIPEDADVVVIYAPKSDLYSEQLAKLDKFLDNGGNLGKNVFYFASTEQPKTPNLDGFLSDWGLSVGYSVIGHTNPEYLINNQTYYIHLQQAEDTDYTADAYKKGNLLGSDLRPVYMIEGTSNTFDILMKTYSGAFLYPLDFEGEFSVNTAEKGQFNDVVMSVKKGSENVSRVCAIGSDALAGSTLMSYANAGNQTFFLGIFDSVCGKTKGVSITPKSFETVYFEMNAETANVLGIILCIAIPVCIIAVGVVIYLRRRHR